MQEQHVVPVTVVERVDVVPANLHDMPVNLYYTEDYLVINAGLPRCLPDRVRVSVAPAKILIKAERHGGEPIDVDRTYVLAELPHGEIGRVLDLPPGPWAFDDAEAHFANGLLTVSIPTQTRAEYLRQMHEE